MSFLQKFILVIGVFFLAVALSSGMITAALWIIAFLGITIILMGLGNKASKKTSVQKSELKAQRQQEYVERQIKISGLKRQNQKYCPKCLSTNFQYAGQQQITNNSYKTKAKYSVNLNPLKPFTLVDKKEKTKVISGYAVDQFVCLQCGNKFK